MRWMCVYVVEEGYDGRGRRFRRYADVGPAPPSNKPNPPTQHLSLHPHHTQISLYTHSLTLTLTDTQTLSIRIAMVGVVYQAHRGVVAPQHGQTHPKQHIPPIEHYLPPRQGRPSPSFLSRWPL